MRSSNLEHGDTAIQQHADTATLLPIPVGMRTRTKGTPPASPIPGWLEEWRDAWRAQAIAASNPTTTALTELRHRFTSETARSPWWLPGVASILTEPRTQYLGVGVFGHLWTQRRVARSDNIHIELVIATGDGVLSSCASLKLGLQEELCFLAESVVLGLQDAMALLTTSDTLVLYGWIRGSDPLLRKVATSSPHASPAARVFGYLAGTADKSLPTHLPPNNVLQCSRTFIRDAVCEAVLERPLRGSFSR